MKAPFGQACDSFIADYEQGFELFPLGGMNGDTIDCWFNKNSTNPMWSSAETTTPTGLTGPSAPHSGLRYLFLETSTSLAGLSDTLSSPSIDISSIANAELSFYFHMYGQSMGSLLFEATGDGGMSWDTLGIVIGEQHAASSLAWTQKVANLPYQDSVSIRFVGTKGPNFYSDMAIDQVEIRAAASCSAPTSLSLSNRRDTSALISWTPGGTEIDWIISYGITGINPDNADRIPAQDSFYQITGIDGTYDAYIRSVCGIGDSSSWFGPITWMTAPTNYQCQNATLIACAETIIDSTFNAIENLSATSCVIDPGTFGLWYKYVGDGHLVSLSTDNPNTDFDTKINVYDGDCLELICETGNDDGGTNSTSIVNFPTKTGKPYFIYVSGFSSNQGVFELDVSCVNCFDPTEALITAISTDSAVLSWTAPIGSMSFVVEYGEADFMLGNGNQITSGPTSGPLTIPTLAQSTEYEVYIWETCGGSQTDTLGPISFTTLCRFDVPHFESFTTYKPACWDEADFGSPQTGPVGLGASSWGNDAWINDIHHAYGNAARINVFFIHSDWFITPEFIIPDTNFAISFELAATEYNDSIPANWPSSDTLHLLYSEDHGESWHVMQTWDSLSHPGNIGETIVHSIDPIKELIRFAFWASSSGEDSPGDFEIFVDNFEIKHRTDIPAVASCRDTVIYLDASGSLYIDPELFNDGNSIGMLSTVPDSLNCTDLGSIGVMLYATTDLAMDSCLANLTVLDTIAPNVLCRDTSLYLPLNNVLVVEVASLLSVDFEYMCSTDVVYLSQDSFVSPGIFNDTVYAIDESGNGSFCLSELIVIDSFIEPEAMCRDITSYLDNCGMGFISPASIDSGSVGSTSLSQQMIKCDDLGIINITLFAQTNGGIDSCMAVVTVIDSFKPILTCYDTFLVLDTNGLAVIDATSWQPGTADNCDIDSLMLTQDTFTQMDVGIRYDTLVAIDVSGNEARCVFEVSISAAIDPCIPMLSFSGSQSQGTYQADTIYSAAFIDSPNAVLYKVGSVSWLLPDFGVELGAIFEVIIEDCD